MIITVDCTLAQLQDGGGRAHVETQNSAPDARELKKRAAAAREGIERRQARLESKLTHALSRQAEPSFRRGPQPLGVRMRIVFRRRHRQNRLGSERPKAGPGRRGEENPVVRGPGTAL